MRSARVIVGQRQDLPGQPGQVLSGRQVAVIVWVFGRLALAPDGGTEQLLGEEAGDRTFVVLRINSAHQSQVILRADSSARLIPGLLDRAFAVV